MAPVILPLTRFILAAIWSEKPGLYLYPVNGINTDSGASFEVRTVGRTVYATTNRSLILGIAPFVVHRELWSGAGAHPARLQLPGDICAPERGRLQDRALRVAAVRGYWPGWLVVGAFCVVVLIEPRGHV